MSAVKSSSSEPAALVAARQRLLAELICVGALALIDATWLQAWFAGPAWPDGWLIIALAAVRLVTWWVARSAGAGTRGPTMAVSLVAVAGFTALRMPLGPWAAALALAAAALMAFQGALAVSDRPDPSSAFRGVSVAFALTVLALYVHKTAQVMAVTVLVELLVASGALLGAARWLEMSDRRTGFNGSSVARASGQLVAAALAMVAGMLVVLTPRVLSIAVLRPLSWLADGLGRLIAWLMLPVARFVEFAVLKLQARATPQILQIINQLAPQGEGDEQNQAVGGALAAAIGRYLAYAVFVILAVIAYRALAAALARRRAAQATAEGAVTVTRLTPVAAVPRARKSVSRRAAPEILDSSPAGQVRGIYRKLLHQAAGFGLPRAISETPGAFAARLTAAGGAADDVAALTRAYEGVRYGGSNPEQSTVGTVRAAAERIGTAIAASSGDK